MIHFSVTDFHIKWPLHPSLVTQVLTALNPVLPPEVPNPLDQFWCKIQKVLNKSKLKHIYSLLTILSLKLFIKTKTFKIYFFFSGMLLAKNSIMIQLLFPTEVKASITIVSICTDMKKPDSSGSSKGITIT